jgi:hypothetical protein
MTPDPPATEKVFGQLATTHGGRIRRRFVAGAGAGAALTASRRDTWERVSAPLRN